LEIGRRHGSLADMKILTIIARVLLGLAFAVFGANFFLNFLPPMGPPPSGPALDFFRALSQSGYLYAIGAMQLIGGLLVLIGLFVPLGLTILAAEIFNIWAFHLSMSPHNLAPPIVVTILELFLLWAYRSAFASLFTGRAAV
jgi:putative oxidoreductase